MAKEEERDKQQQEQELKKLVSSYLGLTFSMFLVLVPKKFGFLIPVLHPQVKELSAKLLQAERQLNEMTSRRREDSKANARVVEIFASHRNAWQAEERRLLQQIDAAAEEIAHLRTKVDELEKYGLQSKTRIEELEREVREREEMITFLSRRASGGEFGAKEEGQQLGGFKSRDYNGGNGSSEWLQRNSEECVLGTNGNLEEDNVVLEYGQPYQQEYGNGFSSELMASASQFWAERTTRWQDVQYESVDALYDLKHIVARRESPWKVDGESTGVSSKLKLLEQELLNLEKLGSSDLSKVPYMMRKQAKRYQALAGKIDDLCRRMQASDPCEPGLPPEFKTQRQTEFLLEAFCLQQRASETGQKLVTLQTEIGKNYHRNDIGSHAELNTRHSLDLIRNNLKEVQRNLEIWLARIIGDLEGILARDGASLVREYYMSRYPFVQ